MTTKTPSADTQFQWIRWICSTATPASNTRAPLDPHRSSGALRRYRLESEVAFIEP
jgi:hypothetical protein